MGRDDGLSIRLLGPAVGRDGGRDLPLGAPRQQAVLVMLASSAGRPVPMSELIDGVWGAQPPLSAEQSVYTYVAGLRRALEPDRGRNVPAKLLTLTPGGYVLRLDPARVDSTLFARLVDQARHLPSTSAVVTLEDALRLWHGPALSGVPGPFADAERARLGELRLAALEDHAEGMLQLGRQAVVLPGLQDLVRRHPLRERLRELLMLALYRCGRQADALEAFAEGRRILAEELGIDPGEGLSRCHELILRGEQVQPELSLTPRQLPRDLLSFVGRATETVRLRSALASWDGSQPAPVVAIFGPPGVGKSALAVRIAHGVADRFPDGQLYANLGGSAPRADPLRPIHVLGRFLRALGVPGDAISEDVDEAAALWRSVLNGKRVLSVLDDAGGVEQIRPLLGASLGNAVVVTSRESLGLVDDCTPLRLGRLRGSEAATMVAKLVGASRCAAEYEATGRLVQLCDFLPLALRIASSRLIDNPNWAIAGMVKLLESERRRLHELESGDLAVRSSFTGSWAALRDSPHDVDRTAARTLELCGLLRVVDVSAEVVGSLIDAPPYVAERALERLASAHLVERGSPGRYHMHDLVRLFAGELPSPDRRGALVRVLSAYSATSRAAVSLWDPHRVQPIGPDVEAEPYPLNSRQEAHDWLVREEPNLVAAASQAMESPDDRIAELGVALAFTLHWYYQSIYRMIDTVRLNERALAIGVRLGDDRIALEAHNHLAGGLRFQGRLEEALTHLEMERQLSLRLGDRFCEQRAYGNMAAVHLEAERYAETLHFAETQLALAREIGSQVGERYALFMTGVALRALARPDEALACLQQALTMAEQAGDVTHEGNVHAVLGEIHTDQGDLSSARHHLTNGLDRSIAVESYLTRARCLLGLARVHRLAGELTAALDRASEVIALSRVMQGTYWADLAAQEMSAIEAARGSGDAVTVARLL